MHESHPNHGYLLEAIKVSDNKLHNLSYHQARMAGAHKDIYGEDKDFDFDFLKEELLLLPKGLHKLRVAYGLENLHVEFLPYELQQKASLKIVFDDHISYPYKFADRTQLNTLFKQRGDCDDIIIVRNELLTDSYYCNIALEKEGNWYTPKTPLLKGTKRQVLIDQALIKEADILLETLHHYTKIRLFNAMIEFGEVEVEVSQVR